MGAPVTTDPTDVHAYDTSLLRGILQRLESGGGGGVATNRSGTLTSGGSGSQVLFPAQARNDGFVQNQSTGDLWLRWDGTDAAASQPSFWLPSGAFVNLSDLGISSQAVKVYGATTGQTISAWEW